MRIIILFLFAIAIGHAAISQTPKKKEASDNRATPTNKNEIQSQMNEATSGIVKEIADLEKQLKTETDEETIKDLKEQIDMLKKQLKMMQGLNKNISMMPDKAVQDAVDDDGSASVSKRDMTRISMLPKKILTEAEMLLFIKNVQLGVEKIIPPEEKTEALKIYNETKAQYKSTAIVANAANGCWMLGHWEKALYIMGRACMDDMTDADNLNNYSAFLIMTGGEQAAIPLLEYLNSKFPNNSTILNNIGQAWFGLGDMDNAKKYLNATIELYPNHSMANSTMAKISLAGPNPDTPRAINFLKASLKESYDPEKEVELSKIGYATTYSDLPPFNYPMKPDPFGLIPLLNSLPDRLQTNVDDPEPAFVLQRYINGVRDLKEEINAENVELDKKVEERIEKLSTQSAFTEEVLEHLNCPAHLLAKRAVQLLTLEGVHLGSAFPIQLLTPYYYVSGDPKEIPLPIDVLLQRCEKFWVTEVVEPISQLAFDASNSEPKDCKELDGRWNAYLAKRNDIYSRGVDIIRKEFIRKSQQLDAWIVLNLYAAEDVPPSNSYLHAFALVDDLTETIIKKRMQNFHYDVTLTFLELGHDYFAERRSNCDKTGTPDGKQGSTDLSKYRVKRVDCEYVKKIVTPVDYEFELKCNTIWEKPPKKMKKRKPDVQKGSSNIASRRNSSSGPIQSPRGGPAIFFDTIYETAESFYKGPLTSENKDISQFSLEYNKWGNLVGLNFQLNEVGTTLKDPDSIESGVDSRWSWNAIASAKKSYLNKLIIK